MSIHRSRRRFLQQSLAGAAMAGLGMSSSPAAGMTRGGGMNPRFRISLAEWSLHKTIFGNLIKTLDFPRVARQSFGIDAIELVNTLLEVPTQDYVRKLKKNADDQDVKILLIMCDAEGPLAHKEQAVRMKSVRNHHKWVDIAADLSCHSIRVNMGGEDRSKPTDPKEVEDFISRGAEAFTALCEYAGKSNINIIIENHGGLSSNADVLVRTMKKVNLPNFGTLPDFGNFEASTDRYESVRKLMPYAKGVSAKSNQFDANGNETATDYVRMMKIVLEEAKYSGYVGIEYEGPRLSEYEGIIATKRLLERFQ